MFRQGLQQERAEVLGADACNAVETFPTTPMPYKFVANKTGRHAASCRRSRGYRQQMHRALLQRALLECVLRNALPR